MLKIGITGGIGVGKSLAGQIFEVLGIPVYSADLRARFVMEHDQDLILTIKGIFGPEAYNNGTINRSYISSKAFADKNLLDKLNNAVHPAVGKDFNEWMKLQHHCPYVLKEAALLFEANSYQELDKIITVFAPQEIRLQRILKRDPHRNEEQALAIISKQLSEEEKMARADYIIYNDDRQMVIPQILNLHQEIIHQYHQLEG